MSDPAALHVARLAVRSLHAELMLYPKPGLVSAVDNGSHRDMDAALFMRSLFSLRGYFKAMAQAGRAAAGFGTLRMLGQAAEQRMLAATAGVNTHRGAIFCLGMLCAAAGRIGARAAAGAADAAGAAGAAGSGSGAWTAERSSASNLLRQTPTAAALQTALLRHWGDALADHCLQRQPQAHGTRAAILHGIGGARSQAAAGMPAVFFVALPALRATLAAGRGWECARIDAFFHLLARLDDSNVHHRGGAAGARLVRECGDRFLKSGGTAHPHWQEAALASHRLLVAHRLSPGGAADLLAAACFVQAITAEDMPQQSSLPAARCPTPQAAASETDRAPGPAVPVGSLAAPACT